MSSPFPSPPPPPTHHTHTHTPHTHTHTTHTHTCRAQFGEEMMNVEQGKKENRSEMAFNIAMAEFLDVSSSSFG